MQIRVPIGDPDAYAYDNKLVNVLMQVELNVQGLKVDIAVHKAVDREGYVAAEWQTGMLISPVGAVYPEPKGAWESAQKRLADAITCNGMDSVITKIRIAQFDKFLNGPEGHPGPDEL